MPLVVQKYGGTSVGSLDHIRNVARHVAATAAAGSQVLVTISAMGEQTDTLLGMALALSPRPPRRELDMLMTAGERVSAALLAVALDQLDVACISLTGSQCGILTDDTHGNARITAILGDRVRASLNAGRVVIVAGFQGVTPHTKEITTLGRGGSDLSAIALAAALKADHCQLYKDVPGVFTADPRSVKAARLLPELSWSAMTALAWGGAAVLHPRSSHLAGKFNIPFEIRSSLELAQPGTRIHGSSFLERPKTLALAHKRPMTLVSFHLASAKSQSVLAEALAWLWQQGEAPQLSQQISAADGQVELTLVVPSALAVDLEQVLRTGVKEAGGTCERRRHVAELAAISIIGQGYKQSPETLALVSRLLGPQLVALEVSDQAITVCVKDEHTNAALAALHTQLIEQC